MSICCIIHFVNLKYLNMFIKFYSGVLGYLHSVKFNVKSEKVVTVIHNLVFYLLEIYLLYTYTYIYISPDILLIS